MGSGRRTPTWRRRSTPRRSTSRKSQWTTTLSSVMAGAGGCSCRSARGRCACREPGSGSWLKGAWSGVASHRGVLSTSRILKADRTCLVVADTSVVLGSAPKRLAVSYEVQARDDINPPAPAGPYLAEQDRLIWSTAGAALAKAPASLARPRRWIRGDADRLAAVSGLVRASLILCPQRGSNPCCRLERAVS
jgi:hypothetical protein